MNLNMGEMTTEEKLKAMEMLWDDICRSAPGFSSPSWHEDVLKEREQRIRGGMDKFVDWDQAKKDIRESIPSFLAIPPSSFQKVSLRCLLSYRRG